MTEKNEINRKFYWNDTEKGDIDIFRIISVSLEAIQQPNPKP